MENKKVLVILDYIRDSYIGHHRNGEIFNRFDQSNDGKYLKGMTKLTAKDLGIDTPIDVKTIFAYPLIPNLIKENKRNPELNIYQPPTYQVVKESLPEIQKTISEYNPDAILLAGTLSAKLLTGVGSIAQLRSRETPVSVDGKSYTALGTYSPGYVMSNPDAKRLAKLDFEVLVNFLFKGLEIFKKAPVHYTTLTNKDVDKIIAVLDMAINYNNTPENPIGWDYETNTLSGTEPTSKILTVSLSFTEGTGITFPIDHPDNPLSTEDKARVVAKLIELYQSGTYLVGHNITFDEFQTKSIFGPVQFKSTLDTLVAYYILVSQDETVSKTLKALAIQYTDMGEYDSALDEFKNWFILGFTRARGAKLKKVYEKTFVEKVHLFLNKGGAEIVDSDYLPFLNDDEKVSTYNLAVHLLDVFKEPKLIRNENSTSEKFDYSWIPYRILTTYASGDTDATVRIHKRFIDEIKKNPEFYNLYVNHYPKLINTLTNIEATGVTLDIDYLSEVGRVFKEELESIYNQMLETPEVRRTQDYKASLYEAGVEEKSKPVKERDSSIYKYYTTYKDGLEFSPGKALDSHYTLFFDKEHQLPIEKGFVTDGFLKKIRNKQVLESDVTYEDFSTSSDAIEQVVKNNPDFEFAKLYQRYARLDKLQSTYTYALIARTDSKGKLHGKYVSTKTGTTRLASKDPNMQNISKSTNDPTAFDYNYPIKRAFLPNLSKGQDTIINLDFSSQEAHLAAVVAKDESMIDSFLNGRDVHKDTASLVFDVPVEEVTKDQRQAAKKVVFGLMYGKTPIGYAADENVTKEEAEALFNKYFSSKPRVKYAMEAAQDEARKNGSIRIPASGFVRQLGNIFSNQYAKQQKALRESFNTVIQGSSAMMTQMALIGIDQYLMTTDINADIIMTVHDSITLSAAHKDVDKAVQIAKYIMEHLPLAMLRIDHNGEQVLFPMEASADVGANYGYEFGYDKEDFYSFKSTKGFTDYYREAKIIEDKEEAKIITKEEYEAALKELEKSKPEYQLIEG